MKYRSEHRSPKLKLSPGQRLKQKKPLEKMLPIARKLAIELLKHKKLKK
jgi:hypothetical protein